MFYFFSSLCLFVFRVIIHNMEQENQSNIDNQLKGRKKAKYSLLTFVLLLCILELSVSALQNINKSIHFNKKIKRLEIRRNEELDKNMQLKSEIKNFNSDAVLESIARNNLKMAGENEVLIIINRPAPEDDNDETDLSLTDKILSVLKK